MNKDNLNSGNQKALDALRLKRLSGDEETRAYRIRAPKWVHNVLLLASETTSEESSKAEALGWFLTNKLSQEDIIELQSLQKKIAKLQI